MSEPPAWRARFGNVMPPVAPAGKNDSFEGARKLHGTGPANPVPATTSNPATATADLRDMGACSCPGERTRHPTGGANNRGLRKKLGHLSAPPALRGQARSGAEGSTGSAGSTRPIHSRP